MRCHGQVQCAPLHIGVAKFSCATDSGFFEFSGCEAECQPSSGERTGFVVESGRANETTVSRLGNLSCASNFTGVPAVTCPVPRGAFVFSGCVPMCTVGSIQTGYIVAEGSPAVSRVADLVGLSCANDYSGAPIASCDAASAPFTMAGCIERSCQPPTQGSTGYTIEYPHKTSVASLGRVECAVNYHGIVNVSCYNSTFTFTGCLENSCAAGSGGEKTAVCVVRTGQCTGF